MLQSIEGVYRGGGVTELLESPTGIQPGTRVIITFLSETAAEKSGTVNLAERGISPAEAAAQRAALASFAEDWERPDMEIYDTL